VRQFEVWRGDEYLGVFWQDELWQFEGERWIRIIDIST